jgi:uncharacterized repeat protein (TIGR01451 family)
MKKTRLLLLVGVMLLSLALVGMALAADNIPQDNTSQDNIPQGNIPQGNIPQDENNQANGPNGIRGGITDTTPPIEYVSPADFSEGFDDINNLPSWYMQNNSDPIGVTEWFQGNDGVFPAHAGDPTAYIAANYNNTSGIGTISNWLLTPEQSLYDGTTLSFWTRTVAGSNYPDRLQVRLSTEGPSTNVGTGPDDVGDFITLLLDINPNLQIGGYPEEWTQFTVTLSGIPAGATGRIAFRYCVTDGGPSGFNSNYIGIDTVEVESPEQAPDIAVDPLSLESILPPDQQETQELNICNVGVSDLEWELQEVENPGSVLAVLWDNGPLITHPGACSDMDASRLQTGLGMNTLGFGHQLIYGYRMADDFTITDPEGWQINQITFFAYQTNAPSSPSPITGVYYQIWDGPPDDPGSSIVFGDLVTNRLLSSSSPNMQRDSETSPCANNRYIFADLADAGVFLPPGTYWIDWMTDGNLSSGPWAPPVTILGETTTGNALQFTTGWAPALDSGTASQQDMPFIIEGEIPSVDIPWLSEDPTSGTVLAGECQAVDVTFDSTGLVPDVYIGGLNISSNDPDEPDVFVDVTLTVPFEADLSVTKTANSDEVLVGDIITYTFDVSNVGPDIAMNVIVTDTLPAEVTFKSSEACYEDMGMVYCELGDLDTGAITFTIVVTATQDGMAVNMAEVGSDTSDPNSENNMAESDVAISPAMYYFYLPIVQKH